MSSVMHLKPTSSDAFYFGTGLFKKNETFSWRPDFEENPHLLIWGASGSGKSYLLREIISYLHCQNKHIHLVDLHGDLETPGDNTLQFGGHIAGLRYGINPFQFDSSSVNAGPKSQIPIIVSMFRSTYLSSMGGIQELVLKGLCSDIYSLAGLEKNDPASWMVDDVEEKTPNLQDMLKLIGQILQYYKGPKTIQTYLDTEIKHIKKLAKKHGEGHDLVQKQHSAIINDISNYLHASYIEGAEKNPRLPTTKIDARVDLTAYSSSKALATLESLEMYTKALIECDIFHSNPPPVRTGVVNRYNLQYISEEVRNFFVEALVAKIFRAGQIRGEYSKRINPSRGQKVDTYIILDEIQALLPAGNEKNLPTQTYNRIASEARKYGIGLIVLTQSPGGFPTPMLSNITKRIGLKTNPIDVGDAKRKLGVADPALFNHLQKPQVAIISNNSGGYDPVNISRTP